MRKLVCDVCKMEMDERDCYDEDGYSKFVHVEIQNSRTYGAEYEICNGCYEKILKFATCGAVLERAIPNYEDEDGATLASGGWE